MMGKMAAVSTVTLLLLFCSIASTDNCDHHATTGGNFTVLLNHKAQPDGQLRWRHNNVLILDRRKNNVFVKGLKENVYENGSLKLTNLNKTDAGKYTPEVYDKDGRVATGLKNVQLCILDSVPMPNVTAECPSSNVKFTCAVGQAKGLNFQWLQDNKVMEGKKSQTLSLEAKTVGKYSFRCKVFNPASYKISEPVKPSCLKPEPLIPKELFGINTWIIVGSGGGVVLVLIIIVIVGCIRTRRKKRLQLKDEGELRLAWTNDQQHHQHSHAPNQHHQHNHAPDQHHRQQPAGHTGPRQHRSKQHRDQQRPKAPDQGHPQPSPRRPAQAPRPVANVDDEQPPPLPQPRKKAPKTPRV